MIPPKDLCLFLALALLFNPPEPTRALSLVHSMAAAEDDITEIAGSQDSLAAEHEAYRAVVPVPAPGKPRKAPMKLEQPTHDHVECCCWLCGGAIQNENDKKFWRSFEVHAQCCSALRCHCRILTVSSPAAKQNDSVVFKNNLATWKTSVLGLYPADDGKRSAALLQAYAAKLEIFQEDSELKKSLLLTKSHYKRHQAHWEGWTSETASEEFDAQLDAADSDNENSDGQARVIVKCNDELHSRRGTRTSFGLRGGSGPASSNSSRQQRRSRGFSEGSSRRRSRSHSPRSRRHQDESGRQDSGRGRRRESQHQSERAPTASRSSPVASPMSLGKSTRRGRNWESSPVDSPKVTPTDTATADSRSRTRSGPPPMQSGKPLRRTNKKTGSQVDLVDDTEGTDDNHDKQSAVAFLARKAKVKKDISEELRQKKLKTFPGNELQSVVKTLDDDALKELRKEGDAEILQKHFEKAGTDFDNLLKELPDIDQSGLDGFVNRFDHIRKELKTHITKAETLLANAKYLKTASKRSERCEAMKERYAITRVADKFKAQFGTEFSKVIAEALADDKTNPLPVFGDAAHMDLNSIMLFDNQTEIGSKVVANVHDYQAASAQSIADKYTSLKSYLDANEQRPTAASPIKPFVENFAPEMPDLSVCLGMLEPLEYEHMEGSAPWLVTTRSLTQRMGPGGFPLPGFGCLVTHVEQSDASTAIMLVPVKALLGAGLTILQDLPNFSRLATGAAVLARNKYLVTLENSNQVLYVPYGFYPIPIALEPRDPKAPKYAAFWVKTLFKKELLAQIPHAEFTAIHLVNQPYLQRLSGQRLWQHRLHLYDRIVADRSAIISARHEAPTLPATLLEDFAPDYEQAHQRAAESIAEAAVQATDADVAVPIPAENPPAPAATAAQKAKLGSRPKAAAGSASSKTPKAKAARSR